MLPKNFKLISSLVCGSHLYGTAMPDSDIDIRGVFIPSKEYFYGILHDVDQFEDKTNDIVYYSLQKFMKLSADNNPNIIEMLFVPITKDTKRYTSYTQDWLDIISQKNLFLSTKCKHTFMGYANSQLNRIKRHRGWLLNPPKTKPERENFGLPKHKSLLTKDEIGAFNKLLSLYLEQVGKHHKLKEQLEEMNDTVSYISLSQNLVKMDYDVVSNIMPISENIQEVLEREKAYMNAARQWESYQKWKGKRNLDRMMLEHKFGYDTKHASHLYRLITEGKELLMKGTITFPRPDANIILDIREGKWSYDRLLEMVDGYEEKFEHLYENSVLPKKPKWKAIEKLCIGIIEKHLNGKEK